MTIFNKSQIIRVSLTVTLLLIAITAPAERLLLKGGIVHIVSGPTLSPGDVIIDGNRIVAVGASLEADGAKVLDVKGQHVYPGLIALNTTLGLVEISSVRATRDSSEVGQFTPDVQSWIAVNPDSELLPVARANGIAYAQPIPEGSILPGHSGLIALAGWTVEEMTVKKPAALHLTWPSMNLNTRPREEARDRSRWKSLEDQAKDRRARLQVIDDFFAEAKAYAQSRKPDGAQDGSVPAWDAMMPFVDGKIPLHVRANDVREMKTAVEWAESNKFDIILVGGRDAVHIAEWLGKRKVKLIYDAVFDFPEQDTASYDAQFRTPAELQKAGVKLALGGGGRFDATEVRNLPYAAAQAVAFGLPAEEALKAITLNAAAFVGMSDKLGSIEAGKEASLFIADGDILDIRSNVKKLWISGREVPLESRHTRLYEKYSRRPKPL